jgi:hypothetical protein
VQFRSASARLRDKRACARKCSFPCKAALFEMPSLVTPPRENRSEDSLAGVPTGLPNTRVVVARNESGPRY